MSEYSQFGTEDQPSSHDRPKKSRLGLYLAVGCGGTFLLCCVGMGIVGYKFTQAAQNAIVEDPMRIAELQGKVNGGFQPPPGFEPRLGIDASFMFIGQVAQGVIYGPKDENAKQAVVILAEINKNLLQQQSAEKMVEDMRLSSGRARDGRRRDIKVIDVENMEVTIGGEACRFKIELGIMTEPDVAKPGADDVAEEVKEDEVKEGEGEDGPKEDEGENEDQKEEPNYIRAVGSFNGSIGEAVLIIAGSLDELPLDEVKKMIQSLADRN